MLDPNSSTRVEFAEHPSQQQTASRESSILVTIDPLLNFSRLDLARGKSYSTTVRQANHPLAVLVTNANFYYDLIVGFAFVHSNRK